MTPLGPNMHLYFIWDKVVSLRYCPIGKLLHFLRFAIYYILHVYMHVHVCIYILFIYFLVVF